MKNDHRVLVAFSGKLDIDFPIIKKDKSVEYWNIKKMPKKDLSDKISELFPSYEIINDTLEFKDISWGMLINSGSYLLSHSDISIIIALFTGIFPQISFILANYGFHDVTMGDGRILGNQNNIALQVLIGSKFGLFVDKYLSLISEYQYNPSTIYKWSIEKKRIFLALMQFEKLKRYKAKSLFLWAQEYSDIATILETVLANEKGADITDINYRLRKRCGILLVDKFPKCEELLKEMYKLRSSFVHGGIFNRLKISDIDEDGFAQVEIEEGIWEKTADLKNMLRFILLCAIMSYSKIEDIVFPQFVDDCLLDKVKRAKIEGIIEEVKNDIVGL